MVHKADTTQGALARIAGEREARKGLDPAASWKKEHQQSGSLPAPVTSIGGEGSDRAQADSSRASPLETKRFQARRQRPAGRNPDASVRSTPVQLRVALRPLGRQDAQSDHGGAAISAQGRVTNCPWVGPSLQPSGPIRTPTEEVRLFPRSETADWTPNPESSTGPHGEGWPSDGCSIRAPFTRSKVISIDGRYPRGVCAGRAEYTA